MTRPLRLDDRGAGAAEFALVLPLLLLLLFGIIDGGRWLWDYNQATKATQAGARVAAVTLLIPGGLATSYIGQTPPGATGALTQGDRIPASALGLVRCTKPGATLGCTCVTTPCPTLTPINAAGWTAIYNRMKAMYDPITEANMIVEYRGSGLGYAGDPDGQDISPLITVKLNNLNFKPLSLLMVYTVKAIPAAATTLTAEDQLGNQSN